MKGFGSKVIRSLIGCLIIMSFCTSVLDAYETTDTFKISKANEYQDKVYIYDLKNTTTGVITKTYCAQIDVPTFDKKKGLITWEVYHGVSLESVFAPSIAEHIRAIIKAAGPQLSQETALSTLQEKTGVTDLTYEDVVEAVQYAIWYYSDNSLEVPSTENGEEIYKYLIGLKAEKTYIRQDFIQAKAETPVRNNKSKTVTIQFSYDTSGQPATVSHKYSKDLVATYKATEVVEDQAFGKKLVTLTFPIEKDEMNIEFNVAIEGLLNQVDEVSAFVPVKDKAVQMMVGWTTLKNLIPLDARQLSIRYQAYQLTIIDDDQTVHGGYTESAQVDMDEINQLNTPGKTGYTFKGWFYKNGNRVASTGVLMNKNQTIQAFYEKTTVPTNPNNPNNPETPNTTTNTPTPNKPSVPSTPGGTTPSGTPSLTDVPDEGVPQGNPKGDPEVPIPEPKIPFGFMPKTGALPLVVIVGTGAITWLTGFVIYRRNRM